MSWIEIHDFSPLHVSLHGTRQCDMCSPTPTSNTCFFMATQNSKIPSRNNNRTAVQVSMFR
eukprot:m.126187 g.126187  ORF g.126187 m.126187 type:complete len:61 (+) comp29184_c2_seq2:1107-1289(+)